MANKKAVVLIALFTAMVTMNFRCVKDDVIVKPYEQTFQVPVNISPLKKSYALTDTIWLETSVAGKMLFDTKSNQLLAADTGQLTFGASFNEFGTYVTNPSTGFCDIITSNGVNTSRQLGPWGTSGYLERYGCGQSSYTCRVGFKPLVKGTYGLMLTSDQIFESCAAKIVPYHATISFRYTAADLGLDIFDNLSKNDKGGNDGIKFYTGRINNRELFVFKVE